MANLPNMRGAIDLSGLGRSASEPNPSASSTPNSTPESSASLPEIQVNDAGQFVLPSLVLTADQESLRSYLPISSHVPVLVDFYTTRSAGSAQLSSKLASEVTRRAGAILLLRIDGDASHALLQAFKIESLPAVAGLLKGQPVPLFAGDQTAEAISTVLDKMLEVAKDNGITGTVAASGDTPAEPELPVKHRIAYEAMESGDFASAIEAFERVLADSPADVWASAGLAQAKLLMRTDGIDLDHAVEEPATTLESTMLRADAHAVCGEFEEAFDALLTRFANAEKAEQDQLRQHLLELFKVATNEHPAVAKARIRLANLLY
ncbi:MAG: tetratricopeptide repeat protein [Micrococcales bacterium]